MEAVAFDHTSIPLVLSTSLNEPGNVSAEPLPSLRSGKPWACGRRTYGYRNRYYMETCPLVSLILEKLRSVEAH